MTEPTDRETVANNIIERLHGMSQTPRDFNPIENDLVRQAAADALALANQCNAGAATKYVRAGQRLLRIEVRDITPLPADQEGG